MPELGLSKSRFVAAMRESRREGGPLRGEARAIARKHGLGVVGSGDFSIVLQHPTSEDKVIALHRSVKMDEHNNQSMKLLYYYSNLLATIFPHNFPKVHASFGNDGDWTNITGTVRERIQRRKLINIFNNKYSFTEAKKRGIEAGMPGFHDFDTNPKNFIVSDTGGKYYIEPVQIFPDQVPHVESAVNHLVSRGNYSQVEKQRISRYVRGLQQLVVEEYV